jgi:hypothetical protein
MNHWEESKIVRTNIRVSMVCPTAGEPVQCSICKKYIDVYLIKAEGRDRTLHVCYICISDLHSATMYRTQCIDDAPDCVEPEPAGFHHPDYPTK